MNQDQLQTVKSSIEKVQVFRGFSVTEAQHLIKLCRPQSYAVDEVVYEVGKPSTEMFIVLQGKLVALNETGTILGDIFPGSTTGEMGVLTGCPRSATVVATEDTRGFVIETAQLESLMRSDADIRMKVLENIVELLCDRVIGANAQIENYANKNKDK
jgi:CRP-like cAMP-binding protein